MIDIHDHIIFDVDDGPKSLEVSVEMLKEYVEQGVDTIITTSHYRRDFFRYDLQKMHDHYDVLVDYIEKEHIPIKLYKGHEAFLNDQLIKDLQSGKCLTMASSDYVLVEILSMNSFNFMKQMLFEISCAGYIPIIAHVERMVHEKSDLDKLMILKNDGYYLQVNAKVILDSDKRYIKKWVFKGIKNGTISFVASDAHDLQHRPLMMKEAYDIISKKIGKEYANRVMQENQEKLIRNEHI